MPIILNVRLFSETLVTSQRQSSIVHPSMQSAAVIIANSIFVRVIIKSCGLPKKAYK